MTGFYDQVPLERHLASLECNSTAAVQITHHFVSRLLAEKKKGCIVFMSSIAAVTPVPFYGIYGASKAFLSQFAASLAVEIRALGIDVCCIHPSPLVYMKLGASVDETFRSIGGCHLRDIGLYALLLRWIFACVNYNVVISAFSFFMPYMSDFKTKNAKRVIPPSVARMSLASG